MIAPMNLVSFPSLEPFAEKVVSHLKEGHDTAMIAAPGCGATTFWGTIEGRLVGTVIRIDVRSLDPGSKPVDVLRALSLPDEYRADEEGNPLQLGEAAGGDCPDADPGRAVRRRPGRATNALSWGQT